MIASPRRAGSTPTRSMSREDHGSHTEADAGRHARAHAEDYDDRPSLSDIAADMEMDALEARQRQRNGGQRDPELAAASAALWGDA